MISLVIISCCIVYLMIEIKITYNHTEPPRLIKLGRLSAMASNIAGLVLAGIVMLLFICFYILFPNFIFLLCGLSVVTFAVVHSRLKLEITAEKKEKQQPDSVRSDSSFLVK